MMKYLIMVLMVLLAGCATGGTSPQQQELADAYYNLGNAHMRLGEHSRAVRAYQRSLEIIPDHYEASCNLASAWSTQGNYRNALRQIESLLEADPEHTQLLNTAAWLNLQLGKAETALALYRQAHQADPGDLEIRQGIVKVLMDLGRFEQARSEALALVEYGGAEKPHLLLLFEIDVHLEHERSAEWLQEAWKRFPGDVEIAEPLFQYYAEARRAAPASEVLAGLIDQGKTAEAAQFMEGYADQSLAEKIQEALPEDMRSAVLEELTQ